ncbi:hypothetical protein T10_13328 [Trichinella papuae]|uniref:Uncharacterized protein n=1 Tax=Trichinella papuae TaxID=268474 RepID=A0A0V1MP21_9BILA|nr:hypothetical protein T10_13328 [Trichinella papuae]
MKQTNRMHYSCHSLNYRSLNYNRLTDLRNFEYVCMQLNQLLNYANSFNYGQVTKCVDWESELTGRGVRPSAVLLGSLVNE